MRNDPYLDYRFRVEIDSLTVGGFAEVSGIAGEIQTEDYAEGGVNGLVHKLAVGTRWPPLVLRRGLTDSEELWDWYADAMRGKRKTKSVRITLLDREGNDTVTWRCLDAHPVRWTGPDMRGAGGSIAIETLEFAHAGIERAT